MKRKKSYFPKSITKAGICLYNQKNRHILVVQSYGDKWGIPKGNIEKTESTKKCAIRETYEETGLLLRTVGDNTVCLLHNMFFLYEVSLKSIFKDLQDHRFRGDEITGIAWVSIDCPHSLGFNLVTNLMIKTLWSKNK